MAAKKKSAAAPPPGIPSLAARSRLKSTGKAGAVKKKRLGRLAPSAKARGLDASQVAIAMDSPEIADLAALVREAGGAPIGAYHEP
jgi:hypothetical protein